MLMYAMGCLWRVNITVMLPLHSFLTQLAAMVPATQSLKEPPVQVTPETLSRVVKVANTSHRSTSLD
jgi:hypothetical protein